MEKPTYEELVEENKRYGKRITKMAERVSNALDIMLDWESMLKRDDKFIKRIEEFIYEK